MQNTFVESMKTIAKLAIDKAGFDKTRTGKIVAVNSVTNTYSVKVDGIIYNNVKTVNDSTYNVGDTVKVNIPMNNPSQSYIASSILSDESFGNKIAQATSAIDAVDQRIDSIVEIMGKIYQLSIGVTYATRTVGSSANRVEYTDATYTAILTQDGENVTQSHDNSEFNWYLEKTTGKTSVGTNTKTITLSSEQYLYGQSVVLEWSYQGEVKLRARVTLFNENAIQQIAKYATEITTGGVFVHRADGIYDVGANWESSNAYGVKIAESVDIVKGGEIYGSFGGTYITIGNTSALKNENNILIDNTTNKIQMRKGSTVLSEIGATSAIIGQTSANYYNTYMDSSNLYFRKGSTILGQINSDSIILGQDNSTSYNTLINTEGIKLRYGSTNLVNLASSSLTLGKTDTSSYNVYIDSSSFKFRKGTSQTLMNLTGSTLQFYRDNCLALQLTSGGMYLYTATTPTNTNILSLSTGGMVLKNASGYNTFYATASGMYVYTGTSPNYILASVTGSGMTLRNSSNNVIMNLTGTHFQVGDIGFWSRNTGALFGMYLAGPDNSGDILNFYASGNTVNLDANYGALRLASNATEVVLGTSGDLFRPSDDDSTNLGTSSYRWKKVYAKSSSISTSDRKDKKILGDIDFAYDLIMSLKPIHYMWKDGDHRRTWMGFIAQDIAEWCNQRNLNLGLYTASYKDEEEEDGHHDGYYGEEVDDSLLNWGLAYEELIAPMIQIIQNQQKTITNLTQRVEQLENKEK